MLLYNKYWVTKQQLSISYSSKPEFMLILVDDISILKHISHFISTQMNLIYPSAALVYTDMA